jgi:hypothetical protein
MTYPYGYIIGTRGTDGDAVDCFLGPSPFATEAYIIHTKNPHTGRYDEDKIFLGFNDSDAAIAAFFENYTSRQFMQGIEMIPVEELRTRLLTYSGRKLAAYDAAGVARFVESEHPRGKGGEKGGQFVKKGGEGSASSGTKAKSGGFVGNVPSTWEGRGENVYTPGLPKGASEEEISNHTSGGEFSIPGTGQKFAISKEPKLRQKQLAQIREESMKKLPEEVRTGLEAGKGTNEIFKGEDGKYFPERKKLHDRIINHYFKGKTPVPEGEEPQFFFVGGGSASGKTTVSDEVAGMLGHNSIDLNVDEVRPMMPEYGAVVGGLNVGQLNEEAGYIRDRIIAKALMGRYNMALDGTGGGSAIETFDLASKQGYKASFYYVHREVKDAAEAAVARCDRTKNIADLRQMKPEWVHDIHNKARGNFEKMANVPNREVKIYDKSDPAFGKSGRVVFWKSADGEVKVKDDEGIKRVEDGGETKFKVR